MKILYITPHLSTGGQPQYLLKKIQTFKNDYEIYCIEWRNITGGVFVVQRNQILTLLDDKFYSLEEDNKEESLNIIEKINPDVIHFEEVPQNFIPTEILNEIYKPERKYKIVVTTHSSLTEPKDLVYLADKFVLVNEWSRNKFQTDLPDIPCDVWEYPIEKVEYDKSEFKRKLGFEDDYKHILNVGLFTPGKNQGELINLAKLFSERNLKVKFHFVGNTAINFKEYWEPLLKDLPDNCIIHGEKSNVSDYYKASDVFYFTSNFELNPLVIKEALSHGLPTFMKSLYTYSGEYDSVANFISNDIDENFDNLYEFLELGKSEESISIFLAHADTAYRKYLLQNCVSDIKTKKLLISNYPVDSEINTLFDWVIVQKENPIVKKELYEKFNIRNNYWRKNPDGQIITTPFNFEHGYAVYQLMQSGLRFAESYGYKKIHFINYDYEIKNSTISENDKLLENNNCIVYHDSFAQKNTTGFFSTRLSYIKPFFEKWQSKKDYYEEPYKQNVGSSEFKILEERFSEFTDGDSLVLKFEDLAKVAKVNKEGLHQFTSSKQEINIFHVISNKYQCDKTSRHIYQKIYPHFFEKFRFDTFNLLEIGIQKESTTKLWQEYFPNSSVFGINIDVEFETKRGYVYKADQSKLDDLINVSNKVPKCRLIIDDGSHIPEHQLKTFYHFFENLIEPGGIYIIEDVECSYWNPGSKIFSYETGYLNIVDYFTKLNHEVNSRYNGIQNKLNIHSITFASNCIIVIKNSD